MVRTIKLPSPAQFESSTDGGVILRAGPDALPLAIVRPQRSVPFDCKFDTVVRECR
jgi:hypothetical protein